ncbi:MAG: DUF6932 family protein [Candidatus Saccharimonadales bacterium]
MIPMYNSDGNLPPGQHSATWREIVRRYGVNPHRRQLLQGLRAALDNLRAAGCRRAYLNGSFITNKTQPEDYELCWEPEGVDRSKLDPLFNLTVYVMPPRSEQKRKYRGEVVLTVANPAVFDH